MDTRTRVAARSRRCSDEQKKHAVRMVFALREELGSSSGTVVRVARQLGYGEESLRRWVAQAEVDTGSRGGGSTAGSRRSMSAAGGDAGDDEGERGCRLPDQGGP
ncbi:MAG: transposase [Acidimicrobiia bacterium]|nr:transposase [Acidimicrobiia bacterium]